MFGVLHQDDAVTGTRGADLEVLAEIIELHLRRQDYQAVAAARVPGELARHSPAAAQCGNLSESPITCV